MYKLDVCVYLKTPARFTLCASVCVFVNIHHLHHGGNRMNPVHVPHEALCQVSYTQTDGPVGVTLQFDHLVGTERHKTHITTLNSVFDLIPDLILMRLIQKTKTKTLYCSICNRGELSPNLSTTILWVSFQFSSS